MRSNGTASAFTTLNPRQPITPTPNAHYATAAGRLTGTLTAAQLPGNVALLDRAQTFTANQTFQTRATFNDRVGIGTASPLAPLHIAGNYLRVDGAGGEQGVLGGDGAGGDVELGSSNPAVNAVGEGVTSAQGGDIVIIRPGNYVEPMTVTKAITLRATRGQATIGR